MSERSDKPDRKVPAKRSVADLGNRSSIIFVTVCTKDRKAIFANEAAHGLLVEKWQDADHFLVGRYVIIPDHVHFFACPSNPEHSDVRRWIAYWKRLVTQAWPKPRDLPLWQKQAWDRQLRSGESYSEKWDYVRANPVRHGLATNAGDWIYQGELNEFEWHGA